jgi:hypothetical protein
MIKTFGCAATTIALVAITAPADAKGCIKGALVGGVRTSDAARRGAAEHGPHPKLVSAFPVGAIAFPKRSVTAGRQPGQPRRRTRQTPDPRRRAPSNPHRHEHVSLVAVA